MSDKNAIDIQREKSSPFFSPDHVPGEADGVLSPHEFMAFTNQAKDPTGLGHDWGLMEVPIETLDKNGFDLHGVQYMANGLVPYTNHPEGGPFPDLVARYDRARAARGVLREVKVLEKLESGLYRQICIAGPRDEFKYDEASRAEFLSFRNDFLRVIKSKRSLAERDWKALEEQTEELKAQFDEQAARARHRPTLHREVSAQPITYSEEDPQGDQFGTYIEKNRPEAGCDSEGSVDGSPMEECRGAFGPTAARKSQGAGEDFGNALGGRAGFLPDED